ncbi:uncharacterized protein LOC141883685 isoform X3 [Acropora palmata]|uniref:uncharacterized protein LOC141883685 isoform X3 n=1 Tax=Acropora palmata TaxID=6131 RepID=UPI003DA036A0
MPAFPFLLLYCGLLLVDKLFYVSHQHFLRRKRYLPPYHVRFLDSYDLSKQKITAIGNIGVNSFWLLSSSGILLMVMTFGSRLNEKIHAIQKIVQTLHVAPEDEGKLLLFVIDLQDEPRGVTVGGFAVITKSLSLTIYGLIVSYFTVMLSLPD